MAKTDTGRVDFAALNILRLVHDLRSFSEAAAQLGINQSVVSYTIKKLRRAFDDPLFYRQGGSVVATERCATLHEFATRALAEIGEIAEPAEFDPERTSAKVTIACNFYERQIILPPLIRALRRAAPRMRIETIPSISQGHLQLKRSEADLLIGPLKPDTPEFFCRNLLTEHYVCVMDPENPLAAAPLTLDSYIAANHAVVLYAGGWRSGYLKALDDLGLSLNQILNVPSPAGIGGVLKGTDLMTTLPMRVARAECGGLCIRDCPCPSPFEIDLVWTTRTHRSTMHIWLRDLIAREVKAQIPPL
ncbi:MAG: LysR family transcriptional regulator [Alterinioella nitratireducens]|uniref:LysR family transcriptional regulator n=1 Tax=Alterinioella nitratireducens TaxID=2735915 RepID=UPI0015529DE1|nr:LysR family transcriptional regulator [Alterinioella nitratireducens]NPD18448.1 LysR family transcriptional regulator [Alterinioella nitratireducens]